MLGERGGETDIRSDIGNFQYFQKTNLLSIMMMVRIIFTKGGRGVIQRRMMINISLIKIKKLRLSIRCSRGRIIK